MNFTTIPSGSISMSTAVLAPEHPKAVLVMIHGMAEHKERYFPFMEYLSSLGIASVTPDLRGHGATTPQKEERGYFGPKGPEILIQDTLQVVRWTRAQFPGIKVFLFGHSMGSMVVRCFCKRYDAEIDGLVVCGSPSADPRIGMGILVTRLFQLFKGSHYRSKRVAMIMFGRHERRFASEGMHNAWLCSNKAVVKAYNDDPDCGFKFTLNGHRTVMQLIQQTYVPKGWQVNNPGLPVHFVAGSEDACVDTVPKFARAVSFFRNRGYRSVTSKIYPGLRHEILNEIGCEEIWRDLGNVLLSW